MSTTSRHMVRPGITLHWGAGGFKPTSFADMAQVGFLFLLSDDATEFPASQMLCAANHADLQLHGAPATPSFHVAVILSSEGFWALLASDESRGARRLREIATGEILSLDALPLTAGARFAVESIRRCPFAGVCREMALSARCNDLLVEFLTAITAGPRR